VSEAPRIAISLLPVTAFLAALILMDSFKLAPKRSVFIAMGVGAAAAAGSYGVNALLLDQAGLDARVLQRYAAPLVEELLKCLYVAHLIRSSRIGFLVDGAIYGFAVGTGFALVENLYYLRALEGPSLFLWIVRGFGTAVLHGSATAVFGILSKGLSDRHGTRSPAVFLPGLGVAVFVHSFFNHFPLHPLAMTAVLLIAMPILVAVVFQRSEAATRDWLGVGFDTDVELLELITGGEMRGSRMGAYLRALKTRFPGPVVGDMLCLLQVHLELSIRAKGILMAREAGLKLDPDDGVRANLEEMKFLERSVGRTGLLAVTPFLQRSSRDLWQLYMLGR
jgi:RsiW-degrading membrane proteinase PrsW (M82 family)